MNLGLRCIWESVTISRHLVYLRPTVKYSVVHGIAQRGGGTAYHSIAYYAHGFIIALSLARSRFAWSRASWLSISITRYTGV
jgi:hypothetical protein